MSQCWRSSKVEVARESGLANRSKWSICCPISASGRYGCSEQQLSAVKLWLLVLCIFISIYLFFKGHQSVPSPFCHWSLFKIWSSDLHWYITSLSSRHSSLIWHLSTVLRMQEGEMWCKYENYTQWTAAQTCFSVFTDKGKLSSESQVLTAVQEKKKISLAMYVSCSLPRHEAICPEGRKRHTLPVGSVCSSMIPPGCQALLAFLIQLTVQTNI